jgi:Fe-S cluster biosynthesis and repair protein YggX
MVRMVLCKKLGREAEGLERAPFPGEKGQIIFETISKAAWLEWVGIQTMLINEHKLASFDPKAKKLIESEREKFLFGSGVDMPDDFVPPTAEQK